MKNFQLFFVLLTTLTLGVTNAWAVEVTMTAGTNGSACTVNSIDGIKVGKANAGGDMTITVPAGATSLQLYAAAWNGVSGLSINITPESNVNPTPISLTADAGIKGNSPFTLEGDAESFKHEVTLSNITSETTLTLTSSTTKRFVVWGATCTVAGGENPGEGGGEDPVDPTPGAEGTGTINFNGNAVKINASSVTGQDDLNNTWTITTVGTTSFTSNSTYYQVGSTNKPATSITFTTTLPSEGNITAFSAKFGGFNATAGTVTLKVDDTSVGTGSLNATSDVTISNSSQATGKKLTVTVTGIKKGVKVYYISYTYTTSSGGSEPETPATELTNAQFAWSAATAEATLPSTFDNQPTLTNTLGLDVSYSSSTPAVATINATSGAIDLVGAGTTTISATFAGGEVSGTTYAAKTVTYALTVLKAPVTPTDNVYVKVTSTAGITDGEYLIVYEDASNATPAPVAFDGSLATLDAASNNIAVTISNHTIAGTNYIDAATFTIDATEKTVKSKSGYYIGQTSDANGLKANSSTKYENALSIENDGTATIKSGGAYLRYNSDANNWRFRYYKSSSYSGQKAIALYKKASEHIVTIATCTNGSVEASVANDAKVLSGTTITLNPTPNSCYKLAAYDVYKTGEETTKVTVTDNTFIMPEFDVTISATFESTQLATPTVSDATTTYNSATLTWEAVTNAAKYSVKVGTADAVETTAISYEVTNLNAATEYTYQVQAIAEADQDTYCDSELAEGSFTTSQAPLATLTLNDIEGTTTKTGALNDTITLPTEAAKCSKTFVGWSANANCTTAPEYAPGASYTLSELTQTLYAVYATANGEETKYLKLTSNPTFPATFAGTYLIVNEENQVAFNGGLTTLDAVGNTISVEITDATIPSCDATENSTFKITKKTGENNYFITSKSGKNIGRTTDANGLDEKNSTELDESTETEYTNTISIDLDSNANIIGYGGAYLRYNDDSDQKRFSYYNSSSYKGQKAIALYKKYSIPLYTNYTTYITISSGTTQTFDTDQQINTLIIEGGATANLVAGNIEINTIILKGGLNADTTDYKMPILYTKGATIDVDHLYLNLAINHKTYYPFAVPFPVLVSDIDYANPTLAAASVYGTHYLIKRYDGAKRAKNGVNKDENWVVVETGDTLQPGVGYIISALTGKSETTTTIQIPLTFVPEQNSTLSIPAHTGTAADHDPIQKGWNFIAHPYLSKYAGSNINNAPRYVSIPTYNFSAYQQTMLMATTLSPEYPFFVQIGEDTVINFTTQGRRQTPASVRADENNQILNLLFKILLADEEKDQTGIILDNSCTPAYEINADLEKMFGSAFTTSIYTLCQDKRLAFNAMSFENAQSSPIPLGYRAAEAGEYTINLDIIEDASAYEDLYEGIVLYDSATESQTNLLYADYTFTTDKIQDDTRFSIQFVPKNNAPTHIENIPHYQTTQKIILNNQLYIIHNGQIYNITGQNIR